jgi:hypothetical protein
LKLLTPPLPVTVAGGSQGGHGQSSGGIGGAVEDVEDIDENQMDG